MVSPQTVLYLSFSPCKATNLTTRCHRKQSFTRPFNRAKLQILRHGVTANSLYLSVSPCKATNLTTRCHRKQSFTRPFTWCHRKQSLTVQSCKQILRHGVTANSLYLSVSQCKPTRLTYNSMKESNFVNLTNCGYKSINNKCVGGDLRGII